MPSPTDIPLFQEPPGDAEVVRRVLGGDTASFEWLMRRYNQRLFRVARSITGDDAEAEDVLQDAYVHAFEHLRRFRWRAKLSTWLTRIVVHEALAHRRKSHRLRLAVAEESRIPLMACPEPPPQPLDDTMPGEIHHALKHAVDSLPADWRVVFTLRLVEKLSTDQVAACLQITPSNVKIRLHRARAQLRRHMEQELTAECRQLYAFDGARCDRIVHAVLGRLQAAPR